MKFYSTCLLLLLFYHQIALADTAYFGLSVMDFGYKEFGDEENLLDREDGLLPGIVAGITREWISADLSYYSNEVDYKGQTQFGTPIETRTDEKIFDFSLQLGTGLYVGLGYHRWERDIQSLSTVSGLFEIYEWWYGLLGAKSSFPFTDKSDWVIDFSIIQPIKPTVEIDFDGAFDKTKLDLGERLGGRFSLAWQYRFNDTMHIVVESYLERWYLGRSATETLTRNGKKVGGVFEPRSEALNKGLTIYLTRSF